jgi:hypothetical protein
MSSYSGVPGTFNPNATSNSYGNLGFFGVWATASPMMHTTIAIVIFIKAVKVRTFWQKGKRVANLPWIPSMTFHDEKPRIRVGVFVPSMETKLDIISSRKPTKNQYYTTFPYFL